MERNDLARDLIATIFEHDFERHNKTDGMYFSIKLGHEYNVLPARVDDSYYPYLDVFLYRPGNYVKVFVRERDIHFYGAGPWVKIYDHDSGWSYDCLKEILSTYQDGWSFDSIGKTHGWYDRATPESVGINPQEHSEWNGLGAAFYLPALRRYSWKGELIPFESKAKRVKVTA